MNKFLLVLCLILAINCKKEEVTTSSFTDSRDGKVYKIVKIGNQWWMAENLCATKYRNGDDIGTTSPTDKSIKGEVNPKYQWAYDGIESNVTSYGRLYTWDAVTDTRGLSPEGWHIPTDAEWKMLEIALGMNPLSIDSVFTRKGTNEGSKLAGSAGLWQNGKLNSDKSFGESNFNGLPGGYRNTDGSFYLKGESEWWWSATSDQNSGKAVIRVLQYFYSVILWSENEKESGIAVRCVKDQ